VWVNAVTLLGAFLAVSAVTLLLTFALFQIVTPASNAYVDIVGYMLLPGLLLLGLLLMPLGTLGKSWRLRRHDPAQKLVFRFPRLDLHDPAQRAAAKFFVFGSIVFLPAVAVSGYHGYHYTDSTQFCGHACHAVMKPQATTHEHSGHARVPCAECHIGAGASWFVKSKLSGTRQVFATMFNTYSRPIPPAIRHLRPARETCEECHWPEKFFGGRLREMARYATDEQSARQDIRMLLNIGGGGQATGRPHGIHMHTCRATLIEFVARDDGLQDVPWVKMTDEAGTVRIFRSDGLSAADAKPAGRERQMDCMDCHNRAAHRFASPAELVDLYLALGRIDIELPFIKREAVAALVRPYADEPAALVGIAAALQTFYRVHYPAVAEARDASLAQAVDGVQAIFRQVAFPEMRVDWRTYPDNIGHKVSPGCYRCHDGRHVDRDGVAIRHDCDLCHTFLNPADAGGTGVLLQYGRFEHAPPLPEGHADLRCDQCHTGGPAPGRTCAECHTLQAQFRAGTLAAFGGLKLPPEPMADPVECEGCHDLTEPATLANINRRCLECHDEDEYGGTLAAWEKEVDQLLTEVGSPADSTRRMWLETLRRAGPLHNLEAARLVLRAVQGQDAQQGNEQ